MTHSSLNRCVRRMFTTTSARASHFPLLHFSLLRPLSSFPLHHNLDPFPHSPPSCRFERHTQAPNCLPIRSIFGLISLHHRTKQPFSLAYSLDSPTHHPAVQIELFLRSQTEYFVAAVTRVLGAVCGVFEVPRGDSSRKARRYKWCAIVE